MKKLLIIILLPLLLLACKTRYDMGITEAEFLAKQKLIPSIASKTPKQTIYKRLLTDDGHGHQTFQYFYFTDGLLTKIDMSAKK